MPRSLTSNGRRRSRRGGPAQESKKSLGLRIDGEEEKSFIMMFL
jgi:hypothetical protein